MYDKNLSNIVNSWDRWLRQEKHFSVNTIVAYHNDFLNFTEFLKNYNNLDILTLSIVQEVNIKVLRNWLIYRKTKKYSNHSSCRAISSLRNFYKYMAKINTNLCTDMFVVKFPKKPEQLPRALTIDEVFKLIDGLQSNQKYFWLNNRDKAILYLLYGLGLRISEALNITKQDIGNDYLRIMGKGGEERIMPLLDIVKSALSKYLSVLPFNIQDSEKIFRGLRGGELLPASYNKILRSL